MKSELMNIILGVVSEVCEVSGEEIRSMRKCDYIVEARSIFATYCKRYGIPSGVIAKFLNRKRIQSVCEMYGNYAIFGKQSYSFRQMCEEVDRTLAVKCPRT